MSFLELDHSLFHFINSDLAHPWLDLVMPALTDALKTQTGLLIVLPLTLLFWLYLVRSKFPRQFIFVALTVGLTDFTASTLIKDRVQRERPEFTLEHVQLKTNSHTGYSFPSNHAANNFALASSLSLFAPSFAPIWFAFATLIAFSRVYVGVHFPSDVIGGALWGLFVAAMAKLVYRRYIAKKQYHRP